MNTKVLAKFSFSIDSRNYFDYQLISIARAKFFTDVQKLIPNEQFSTGIPNILNFICGTKELIFHDVLLSEIEIEINSDPDDIRAFKRLFPDYGINTHNIIGQLDSHLMKSIYCIVFDKEHDFNSRDDHYLCPCSEGDPDYELHSCDHICIINNQSNKDALAQLINKIKKDMDISYQSIQMRKLSIDSIANH